MKKIFKYITAGVLAAGAMISCNQADKFQYGKEVLIMGSDKSAFTGLVVDNSLSTSFNVLATGKVKKDVVVNFEYDAAAVESYNTQNGTKFTAVPEEYVTFESNSVTIPAGKAKSEPIKLTLTGTEFMEAGPIYVIPVSITSVEGNAMEVLSSSRTYFVRLQGTVQSPVLYVNNTSLYSTYKFEDPIPLQGAYTVEVKVWFDNLKSAVGDLVRFFCLKDDAGGQMLYRMNENGTAWKSLDIVAPNGRYDTHVGEDNNGNFDANKWYMISIVWDGSAMTMYINGEKDEYNKNTVSGDQNLNVDRIEIGMSWTSYGSSQSFNGRMCEIRLWDYARSQSQIAESQCYVDPETEGLLAYWPMSEGSGHIFNDKTSGARHMDWSKTEREKTEGTYSATPEAGSAVKWVNDRNNRCAQ